MSKLQFFNFLQFFAEFYFEVYLRFDASKDTLYKKSSLSPSVTVNKEKIPAIISLNKKLESDKIKKS